MLEITGYGGPCWACWAFFLPADEKRVSLPLFQELRAANSDFRSDRQQGPAGPATVTKPWFFLGLMVWA
jgi:hypothetical protein